MRTDQPPPTNPPADQKRLGRSDHKHIGCSHTSARAQHAELRRAPLLMPWDCASASILKPNDMGAGARTRGAPANTADDPTFARRFSHHLLAGELRSVPGSGTGFEGPQDQESRRAPFPTMRFESMTLRSLTSCGNAPLSPSLPVKSASQCSASSAFQDDDVVRLSCGQIWHDSPTVRRKSALRPNQLSQKVAASHLTSCSI